MSSQFRNWVAALALGGAVLLMVLILRQPESAPEPGSVPQPALEEAGRGVNRDAPTKEPAPSRGAAPARGANRERDARSRLDADDLVEVGISADKAEQVVQRIEAAKPARAALLAALSGARPNKVPELSKALLEADAELEEEIGSDEYDRMLYAAGENNRVRLVDVVDRSAGEEAGLWKNDTLYRYNGHRIYSTDQLHFLAIEARRGTKVPIEWIRSGKVYTGKMKAGEPGMFMKGYSADPQG